ncbi:hypothetical protein [Streptomyces sp. NPDC059909]|uniref:hypothetical protein n=1 Tax=Streptomyces sp. NPDC059909 TaxID=3346998 RepID=UPI00366916C9
MHKLVRMGVAAAGLATALALTGCGSSDEPDKGRSDATATPSGTADGGSGDGSGPGSGDDARPRDLEGTWAGLGDSKVIALSVRDGHATLVAGQHVCSGEVQADGKVTLALKCIDGDTERTSGTVDSNDGTTLVVSWSTGAKDTLTKTEPGGAPSVFPSGLPTGLPTAVPQS